MKNTYLRERDKKKKRKKRMVISLSLYKLIFLPASIYLYLFLSFFFEKVYVCMCVVGHHITFYLVREPIYVLRSRLGVGVKAVFLSPVPHQYCTRPGQARGGSAGWRCFPKRRKLGAGAREQGRCTIVCQMCV